MKWSVAHRSLNDAADSGDLCVVQPFPDGILIAALDGAGHGREAGVYGLEEFLEYKSLQLKG